MGIAQRLEDLWRSVSQQASCLLKLFCMFLLRIIKSFRPFLVPFVLFPTMHFFIKVVYLHVYYHLLMFCLSFINLPVLYMQYLADGDSFGSFLHLRIRLVLVSYANMEFHNKIKTKFLISDREASAQTIVSSNLRLKFHN